MRRAATLAVLCVCTGACSAPDSGGPPPPSRAAAQAALVSLPPIDAAAVLEHTKNLSSDRFEGRSPGSRGEELTVNYLIDAFTKLGLQPGNTDGTYVQQV